MTLRRFEFLVLSCVYTVLSRTIDALIKAARVVADKLCELSP